jgi:hypothetical protein
VPVDSTKQWYSIEYKKIPFLLLHGGKMWSLALKGEHELQMFGNKFLQENIWV